MKKSIMASKKILAMKDGKSTVYDTWGKAQYFTGVKTEDIEKAITTGIAFNGYYFDIAM